jgi:hypothetical protein
MTLENLQAEHRRNINRGLTFEASDKTDTTEEIKAEAQEDARQKPKARVRRHTHRKRIVRPSRNKKERVRLATA